MTSHRNKLIWNTILKLATEHRANCNSRCGISLYLLQSLCKYLTGRDISMEEIKILS